MSTENINKQLKEKYQEIVLEYSNFLKMTLADDKWAKLHLGSIPDGYLDAKNKILIIGRETKCWLNKTKFEQYNESVITNLMDTHYKFFKKQMSLPNQKGKAFFNFIRKIAKHSGQDGLLWANMFSLSYNQSNPMKKKENETLLLEMSDKLLKVQLDILKPEIVIFANGFDHSSIKARRRYFPTMRYRGEGSVENLPKKCLEEFFMPDEFDSVKKCYRVSHPSAVQKKYQEGIKELINLLPKK